jgi:hypothetical protein
MVLEDDNVPYKNRIISQPSKLEQEDKNCFRRLPK